jgi:hypothetical protein
MSTSDEKWQVVNGKLGPLGPAVSVRTTCQWPDERDDRGREFRDRRAT